MRAYFFGADGSTAWRRQRLERDAARLPPRRRRHPRRGRDGPTVRGATARRSRSSSTPRPSRRTTGPRASRSPTSPSTPTARSILLEATRRHCPDAPFIFTSTNKVYGDTPNRLPLVERETRWEVDAGHPFSAHGIDESMSIDAHACTACSARRRWPPTCMVQEYGRYFGLKTGVLPRRLPHRAGPLRRRAPRLPVLPREVRRHRTAVHRLRLQGQAGPRQHPLARSRAGVLALLQGAAPGRGLQHGRRPGLATARCSKRSPIVEGSPAGRCLDVHR